MGAKWPRTCTWTKAGSHASHMSCPAASYNGSIWKLLMRTVEKRGIGVLAIGHDVELLKRVSHRVVEFHGQAGQLP
jgi:ABC-type dipeptide/oligopeptide/nickel transport system ATPase subunit